MNTLKRTLAAAQLLLILPAALFMLALVLRGLQPPQFEPAHTAQQVVLWYSGRVWTLWVLLGTLPLIVLLMGAAMLLGRWSAGGALQPALRQALAALRTEPVTRLVATVTLCAGVILVMVCIHALMN